MNPLHLLSAGAAQALATGLQERFLKLHGQAVAPTFGAVGVMKDKLLTGAPCDVLILTDALINQLTSGGHLRAGSARPLGVVKTGVAVKTARPASPSARRTNSRRPCWRPPASTLPTRSNQQPAFTS